MLSVILGFVTGLAGPIANIASRIVDLQAKKVNAATEIEKARIDQQLEEAHDRKAVLVAEAGNRLAGTLNASMRLAIALGPMTVLTKIFFWDKVVGSFAGCAGEAGQNIGCETFRTDALDTNLWAVITAVIAFYFVYDLATRLKK